MKHSSGYLRIGTLTYYILPNQFFVLLIFFVRRAFLRNRIESFGSCLYGFERTDRKSREIGVDRNFFCGFELPFV